MDAATLDHDADRGRRAPWRADDAADRPFVRWSAASSDARAALVDWVEVNADPVVALDAAGCVLVANAAFLRVFGPLRVPSAGGRPALSTHVPLLTPARLARWSHEASGGFGAPRVHRLLAEAVAGDGATFLAAATLMRVAHRRARQGVTPLCVVALRPLDGPRAAGAASSSPQARDDVALGPLLDAALREMGREGPRGRCRLDLHDPRARVAADPDGAREALVRLLGHASAHATPGTPIAIRTRGHACEPADAPVGAPETPHVVITIANRGRGMTRAQRQRAFEPFAPHDGADEAGVSALAVAREWAHAQRGWLELRSEPGVGTEVELWLPAA